MREARYRPEAVIGTVLGKWCNESFPGLPHSGLPSVAALRQDPAVGAFVEFVKAQDLLEATYWCSSAYALLIEDARRKQLAMFFTPPSITRRLLHDLEAAGVDFARRRFCDPACGGAAFLVPIAIRMRDALRRQGMRASQIVAHVQTHLLGLDRDAILCAMSRQFIRMVLHNEVVASGHRPRLQVQQGDSLLQTANLLGTLDVVVCNPPFRKMPALEVQAYAREFQEVIEAQPNLYTLFIALCVRLLAPGGTCALVTPTSYLSGHYFSKLRRFLMAQTTVLGIGMVSDRLGVFIDVEQETALTLLRRESTGHPPAIEAEVSVVTRSGAYLDVGRCVLPNSGAAWPIPRTDSDVALLKHAAHSHARLHDYGYVARIGAFVWNRDTRPTYASAKGAVRARGGAAVPLLWSSDIGQDGKLRFTGDPKSNREPSFVNLGKKDHRSVVRRPAVLLQRVTSNDQPRRLVAAAVPRRIFNAYGGFVGENHTVILEQVVPDAVLTPRQLARLLGTPTVDRYFRCISGATNVSVFELNQLRLPDPARLRRHLAQSSEMAEAARKAF